MHFVRTQLDTAQETARYDMEFLCETAAYNYSLFKPAWFRAASLAASVPMYCCSDVPEADFKSCVLPFDHDAEYYHHAQAANAGSEQITEEQAKQLALQHAGVAEKDARRLQIKFDYDDGRGEYEVEWSVGYL